MKVLHYISILLLLLSLAACRDSRIDDLTEQRVLGDSLYIQLTLDLSNMSATRANPNGGEQGDGWEYGLPNENEIQDFSLFIFKGYDINGDEDAPVYLKRYFSPEDVETATITEHESVNGKEVLSYEFKIPIIKGEDADNILNNIPLLRQFHFMVAANVGDITEEITTLGQFRDYIPTQTFSPSTIIEDYERFVMSNESDAFYKSGAGTMKDPVRMHVSVERLAARIDFDKTNSVGISDDNKSLIYELKSSDNTTVLSKLYLDELQIINGSIQPSYLIKRVAKDINGTDLTYLGDETPTPNGIATNYVIDPYSALKTDANRTNTELNLLGTLFGETPTPRFSLDPTKDNQILGYVNENTFDRTCTFAEYTTGVQLKCRFVPKHNYYVGYNAATDILLTPEETAEDDNYTLGATFYMVEPNTSSIDESQRLYFSDFDDAQAYAKKHFCTVVTYTDGVCYYYIYMRHSNNVEVIHDTMEFGIVRNNIYRFSINAATGPGTPTPDPRHPEELKARIYVKKWVSVEHPIIYV